MNKDNQKELRKSKRKTLFIEVSGNPWFITNPNYIGFYSTGFSGAEVRALDGKK